MKINVGGQKGRKKCPSGWKIVDVREGADYRADLMKEPLPFEDSSIEAIYTSHTLEHLYPHRLPGVLSEFRRVLKSDGLLRVVVPDIDIGIQAYIKGDKKFLRDKRNPRKMDFMPDHLLCYLSCWFFTYREDLESDASNVRGHGHLGVFNWELLSYYLMAAGFSRVVRRGYGDCDEVFRGCDFERYRDCSLYVEAGM